MNVDVYLKKLGCSVLRDASPTLENLEKLMLANLSELPFDNCDMQMGEFQKFSLENSYDRLMNQGKGGYCIQLNGVFHWLLKQLGYQVTLQPVYIYNNLLKKYYRLPIHMTNIVWFQKDTEKIAYYTEVATLRPINEPLKVELGIIQKTKMGIFRFLQDANHSDYYVLQRTKNGSDLETCEWTILMKFKITGDFELADFNEMNNWVQTPEHPINFYKTLLSKHSSPYSYILLLGRKFIETTCRESGEEVITRVINDDEEILQLIRERFKINIDYDRFKSRDDYNLDTLNAGFTETAESELPLAWKKFILP